MILPGEAFGQPRHLYMGDPTFIFGGTLEQTQPYITVTLGAPVALSALAITTTPWDRCMHACVFQVREANTDHWVDIGGAADAAVAPSK